jgi:hypothetical protein
MYCGAGSVVILKLNGKGMLTMTEYSEAVTKALETVFEQIRPVMNVIMEGFRYYCKHYGNKRVVHLALHAKKERVRNKNRNRIFNAYLTALQRGVVR